jgi:hypothetical protein
MTSHLIVGSAVAAALVGLSLAAPPASADVINFNTCWSSCANVGGGVSATVATLELAQDGTSVNFTFTNTVANLGSFASSNTFISELLFSYDGDNSLDANDIGNYGNTGDGPTISDANFAFGNTNNASLTFQIDLNLPTSNSGGGVDRFKNGETLTWTISDVEVAEFLVSANVEGILGLVHIQSLSGCTSTSGDCGSVKYVDGPPGGGDPGGGDVPEPATLTLLSAGLLGLVALRRRRRAA